MKIINQTLEVFYTEEELNNSVNKKHREELEKQGYEYNEGYFARLENEKGFIVAYRKYKELKIY